MTQVALFTIGIALIAYPPHPCQQQFRLLPPQGATTMDSTIRPAKSKVEVKVGVMEHSVPTIITLCHGMISTAGQQLVLLHHLPRSQIIPQHSPLLTSEQASLKPPGRI